VANLPSGKSPSSFIPGTVLREALTRRQIAEASQLISIVDEARPMITAEQLDKLAGAIFTWKEKLSVTAQLHVMPALQRMSHGST
jgi:hypothetical protein